MKKLKLGFCRIKCELSFHVKILVNTKSCWPIMQKFTLELKSSPKTCFFDDMDKMMGVLWNIDFLIMTHCFKHFSSMYFHQNLSMFSYLWNSSKNLPSIFWLFSVKHVFGDFLNYKVNFSFLVNKCWPKILHEIKVQTSSYRTLFSFFIYLSSFLRYFSFSGYRFLKWFIVRKYA